MKKNSLLTLALLSAASYASAAPTLITGTPANSLLSTPTGPSPHFGTIYNFDSLAANTSYVSYSPATGVTISSPDGLVVIPFSTQSSPNELFDNSANGTANTTVTLAQATNEIGIGLADSDGTSITLQALDANGTALGSAFSVTLPSSTANPFNGYFAISGTSFDIYGLKILQTSGNANFSGLAIDDLQVASTSTPTPEPGSMALIGLSGAALLAFARLRERA